ncbi:uncharacterized protein TNCV_263401, partial [Trichonephila clavipes]
MVSWDYLWPTLRCRRVAGVSPLLSIGWWYLSSGTPKRHCCRVSAADKGCRVYPLDPRPDAVALYSGCTSVAPYIPNPLHCFKCQRFALKLPAEDNCAQDVHLLDILPQIAVLRRNASIVHSLTPLTQNSVLNGKAEKEIQAIKTNRNISYLEARKLIAPQLSQTYAQVAKPSTATSTTQTDENITKINARLCNYFNLYYPFRSQ